MSIELAIKLACCYHDGQTRLSGLPFICHPLRVMNRGKNESEMIVGVLHDIIEDTVCTQYTLCQAKFSPKLISVVGLLTHTPEFSYEEYIEIVKTSPLARQVKINDLEDNMDQSRLTIGQQKSDLCVKWMMRYRRAMEILKW